MINLSYKTRPKLQSTKKVRKTKSFDSPKNFAGWIDEKHRICWVKTRKLTPQEYRDREDG
jgi:antibiotic biosynthesis monooxygenase (ABM) superfamily enzyme